MNGWAFEGEHATCTARFRELAPRVRRHSYGIDRQQLPFGVRRRCLPGLRQVRPNSFPTDAECALAAEPDQSSVGRIPSTVATAVVVDSQTTTVAIVGPHRLFGRPL